MTTQPKLPEWAELFIKEKAIVRFTPRWVELLDKPGDDFMCMRDVQDLASRLMAEIVPEGYVVIPAKQLADLRHLAAYVGLAAKNTPFMPVGKVMEDAMRDIPDPGPAAEPCKNPNCKGGMLRVGENAWAYCPDCNCTETKLDPPGHADYVAAKQAEGGGKPEYTADEKFRARQLYNKWTNNQGIHCNRFPSFFELTEKDRDKWYAEARACHEGARP